ncbi:MAG: histidine phosphatase family protein [Myxococcota bacterium]
MFDQPTARIIPSEWTTRVHLFRHGEVAGARVCRGQSDAPLSERGLAQTAAAAGRFREKPDVVFSSDLSRCMALARAIGGDVVAVPELREQHMGEWDGFSWPELTARDPLGVRAYWNDYVNARPPGGESYGDCYLRVNRWWAAQDLADKRVVVVTHIGVIRALTCEWLGMGPHDALRWAPAYASHTQVLLAQAGCVVERFGEV